MSLASENPERYDEFVRKGIVKYLDKIVTEEGFTVPGEWYEGYVALVESLQQSLHAHTLYDDLRFLAHKEISAVESEYFSGLVDEVKERHT